MIISDATINYKDTQIGTITVSINDNLLIQKSPLIEDSINNTITDAFFKQKTEDLTQMIKDFFQERIKNELDVDLSGFWNEDMLSQDVNRKDPIDRLGDSETITNFHRNELPIYQKTIEICNAKANEEIYTIGEPASDTQGNKMPNDYYALKQNKMGNSELFWNTYIDISDEFFKDMHTARDLVMNQTGLFYGEDVNAYMKILPKESNYNILITDKGIDVALFHRESQTLFMIDDIQQENDIQLEDIEDTNITNDER